jgi:hypothetical protein
MRGSFRVLSVPMILVAVFSVILVKLHLFRRNQECYGRLPNLNIWNPRGPDWVKINEDGVVSRETSHNGSIISSSMHVMLAKI